MVIKKSILVSFVIAGASLLTCSDVGCHNPRESQRTLDALNEFGRPIQRQNEENRRVIDYNDRIMRDAAEGRYRYGYGGQRY